MPNMPYNTRRKSLSLPSLGIQLPSHSRAHRSNSKSNTPPSEVSTSSHPTKRVKRSHNGATTPSPSASPRQAHGSPVPLVGVEHTPPPSPQPERCQPTGSDTSAVVRKIDTDGIHDDVVIAVIEQLEKTNNRPHLIRELATILGITNQSIAHSANPAALLSSRLTSYLKRPWTVLSPCPLAKELIPVHPRKVFYFLTTQPRGPLPQNSDDVLGPEFKRLTPSITDSSVEDMTEPDRRRMSLSPDVELYSPHLELDHSLEASLPPTPSDTFGGRDSAKSDQRRQTPSRPNPHHAPSPQLEADERGFTETATAVRQRRPTVDVQPVIEEPQVEVVENAEISQRRDQELLFGGSLSHGLLSTPDQKPLFGTSPMILPKVQEARSTKLEPLRIDEVELGMASWSLMSPEAIDVEDLDVMFEAY